MATTTKKAPPPSDGGNGQVPGPWYHIFWPPLRWGVYVTYEIIREIVTRENQRKTRKSPPEPPGERGT